MAERLHSIRLFEAALVSGLASGIISSALNLRNDVLRLEGLLFMVSSPTSRADVGFRYAISPNNADWGSFADNDAIQASTVSLAGVSAGWVTVTMPNVLAPYVRFNCSGTGSNPTDTRVTVDLLLRLT